MDPNITPSGQQPDDQGQVITAEPPVTQQPPGTAPQRSQGPFSAYLDPSQTREPTHTASQQRPSGFMGPAGKTAMLLDSLIGGLAKGRATAYNRSVQQQAATYGRIKEVQDYLAQADIDPDTKNKLAGELVNLRLGIARDQTAPEGGGEGGKSGKKKGKEGDQNRSPILDFFHKAATAMLGPGAQAPPIDEKTLKARLFDVVHTAQTAQTQTGMMNKAIEGAQGVFSRLDQSGKLKDEKSLTSDPDFGSFVNMAVRANGGKMPPQLLKLYEAARARGEAKKPTDFGVAEVGGKVVNVQRSQDQVLDAAGNPLPLDKIKPGSLRWGNEPAAKAPTKAETDLEDSKRFLSSLLNDKDPKTFTKEESHVAERVAGGDKELRDRFEVNVKKGMPVETAYNAAIAAHVKSLDSKQTGLDLSNDAKAILIAMRQDGRKKLKPDEVRTTARSVINDVFRNKDPKVQAWATKLRERMLAAKTNPNDAAAAAQEFREAVQKNVESADNYVEFNDEQREQISSAVGGMEWDKIIPYVKGAGAAGGSILSNPLHGKPPAPSAQISTAPPPGSAAPARRAANEPPKTPPPPTKVLGTESQLRAKAKAAGRTPAEIDQMVAEYKQAGYIK
jgi:hypothetical protein